MKLNELKEKKVSDLREIAKTMGIEKITSFSTRSVSKVKVGQKWHLFSPEVCQNLKLVKK